MAFFRKKEKEKGKIAKIFFATDVHGSDITFRKFLNSAKFYGSEILILGGDLTGKQAIPIIDQVDGTYTSGFLGQRRVIKTATELEALERNIRDSGNYIFHTTEAEVKELESEPSKLNDLFSNLMTERLEKWLGKAEELVENTGVKIYVTGGNDDPVSIESLIRKSKHIIDPEGEVVKINDYHEMMSFGYTNITPWKCPRDITEDELAKKIEAKAAEVENMSNCIFNLHCPPLNSQLDTCQKLNTSVYPPEPIVERGEPVMFGAGSTAVREAIEKYQPLLGLHGHIHEARGAVKIGRTLCVNPGSEYGEGVLRGVLISIDQEKILGYQFVSG